MALLSLGQVSKSYAGLQVLRDVDLSVEPGERRAIIGPNGAGKSTLFHIISGQVKPNSGTIRFDGADVTGLPPYHMAARGLARTFQTNNLFLNLSTFANVQLAVQRRQGVSRSWFRPWWAFDGVNARTDDILHRMDLYGRRDDPVKSLSYGEQRQLEVAIALAGDPKILLLDEPTAGMSVAETAHAVDMVAGLPRDLTMLIIEHDMDTIFALADRITVLDHGQVIADGTPSAVRADPQVRTVYLGDEDEDVA
ncbi:MAG: ABC transporter ATP-binding protein [Chloroflexota bacterium]